jgi:hypothetical protein
MNSVLVPDSALTEPASVISMSRVATTISSAVRCMQALADSVMTGWAVVGAAIAADTIVITPVIKLVLKLLFLESCLICIVDLNSD